MAKSYGEKLKILYLRDFLLRETDEKHPATVADMIAALEEHEIYAERKSIYRDLKVLGREEKEPEDEDEIPEENYGMGIVKHKGAFYVKDREFTLQEVKLLVDMVQSSNFITKEQTKKLIDKLEGLASSHEAKTLQRTVFVRNRVKAMNDSVFVNVDRISDAINEDRTLNFQYFSYNLQKKKDLRHNGEHYTVSPFALIWVDQNYYLLGYAHKYNEMRAYRVDRMTNVKSAKGPRLGKEEYGKIDIATFTTKVFHMYMGELKRVTIRFSRALVDTVIDRFGVDTMLIPDGDGYFTVNAEVAVSPQFYGWVAGFGSLAEIISPAAVREGMRQHLQGAADLYNK